MGPFLPQDVEVGQVYPYLSFASQPLWPASIRSRSRRVETGSRCCHLARCLSLRAIFGGRGKSLEPFFLSLMRL